MDEITQHARKGHHARSLSSSGLAVVNVMILQRSLLGNGPPLDGDSTAGNRSKVREDPRGDRRCQDRVPRGPIEYLCATTLRSST